MLTHSKRSVISRGSPSVNEPFIHLTVPGLLALPYKVYKYMISARYSVSYCADTNLRYTISRAHSCHAPLLAKLGAENSGFGPDEVRSVPRIHA